MGVFNLSLTLKVSYLRTIRELVFSHKGYYCHARKGIMKGTQNLIQTKLQIHLLLNTRDKGVTSTKP